MKIDDMKSPIRAYAMPSLAVPLPRWLRALFNLNDSRWGRGDDKPPEGNKPDGTPPEGEPPAKPPGDNGRNQPPNGGNGGPPDLDELWRDFNRKLGGLFGKPSQPPRGGGGNGGGNFGGGMGPDMRSASIVIGMVLVVVFFIWMGTGMFVVQEGEQAVITRFGKYDRIAGAGFNVRLPSPIERHEKVMVTQIRSVDVGRDNVNKATGLKESAMLTQDENILDVKFAVQYRLNDARAFLFESKDPEQAVVQAAETSVREVVGKMKMDAAISEERDQIAPRVRAMMQNILDRYKVGVEIVGINMQQGGVRPPEQVQASFDDVLKAGQERERSKSEAEAYARDVIPRAVGSASRLSQEADAYKARVVATASGDAQRFRSVLAEYQKAPQVTRDRMYLDTMQQIYGNVTKVLVDSRQGSNLLYLPLDKIMQMSASASSDPGVITLAPSTTTAPAHSVPAGTDSRSRDAARTRDRESR